MLHIQCEEFQRFFKVEITQTVKTCYFKYDEKKNILSIGVWWQKVSIYFFFAKE